MTTKKVFSASDAHPTVLHAKRDADSEIAYPILVDPSGALVVSGSLGGGIPPSGYDYIDLSPANKPTTITYKSGGSGGSTVATLTLTYSGNDVQTVNWT